MIKQLIFSLIIFCVSMSSNAEKGADLASGDMKVVRIHTTQHIVVGAEKMVLIQIDGLESPCNSGVFLNAVEDPETLSVVLSAHVSKASGRIGYEPSKSSPWGDVSYCALTYFDIK